MANIDAVRVIAETTNTGMVTYVTPIVLFPKLSGQLTPQQIRRNG